MFRRANFGRDDNSSFSVSAMYGLALRSWVLLSVGAPLTLKKSSALPRLSGPRGRRGLSRLRGHRIFGYGGRKLGGGALLKGGLCTNGGTNYVVAGMVAALGLVLFASAPELALAQVGATEPVGLGFGAKLMQLIPMFVIVGGVFYLIVIGPQNKRIKEQQTLLAALKKGDSVVTSAGIYGKVFALGEDHLLIEIAPNVRVKCERRSIMRLDQAA